MQTHTTLTTRFAQGAMTLRREEPLSEPEMRAVAPSIFAAGKHGQPLRALHLHPDHRCAAGLAPGRLRAVHGGSGGAAASRARASSPNGMDASHPKCLDGRGPSRSIGPKRSPLSLRHLILEVAHELSTCRS